MNHWRVWTWDNIRWGLKDRKVVSRASRSRDHRANYTWQLYRQITSLAMILVHILCIFILYCENSQPGFWSRCRHPLCNFCYYSEIHCLICLTFNQLVDTLRIKPSWQDKDVDGGSLPTNVQLSTYLWDPSRLIWLSLQHHSVMSSN